MHRSYPTPAKKELDVGSNNRAAILKTQALQMLEGSDLLALDRIAEFWSEHHYNQEYNKAWRPIYKRTQKEILRRLEAGRV